MYGSCKKAVENAATELHLTAEVAKGVEMVQG